MQATALHDTGYSWFRLVITLCVAVVGNAGTWAIVIVLPALQAEFGIDRAGAALPYTATMIGFGLGNLIAGRLVDRHGVTWVLILAAIMIALSFGLSAVAVSVPLLALLHLFVGLGSGACFGPLMADISHWFVRFRGIAVAITASGNYLSGAIWPLLLSGVAAQYSWRGVFVVLAALSVLTIVPLALVLGRRHQGRLEKASGGPKYIPNGGRGIFAPNQLTILLGMAGIGCCVAMAMPQVHIVALSVDLGFGAGTGSRLLAVMLVGGVISRLVFGALSDRLGGLRVLLIGSFGQVLALVLYLPFDGLTALYATSLIFGLSQGGIVPAYAFVVREFMPAEEAGKRVGFVISATVLGMALGGWLSGMIYDLSGNYQMAFLNGIGWNLLNLAIITFLLWRSGIAGRKRKPLTS